MRLKKAFTMLELLLVVIVIALLAAFAIVSYMGHVEKAKAGEAYANLGAIRHAEEARKMLTGEFASGDSADEINQRLDVIITPKYYEYRVTGVTDDNFIVIAKRIGSDETITMGGGMPGTTVIAMDRYGRRTDIEGEATGGGGGGGGGTGGDGGGVTGGGGTGGWGGGGGGTGGGSGGGDTGGGTGGDTGGGEDGVASYTEGGTTTVYQGHTGGGWSDLAPAGQNGAVVQAGLEAAMELLRTSTYAKYAYDLLQARSVNVQWSASLPGNAAADWSFFNNRIRIDTVYMNNASAVAALIAHEATHADYSYYQEYWIAKTLERHPELTRSDLSIPYDSINQEYDAFVNQVETWKEVKREADSNNDVWLAIYNQGEDYMRSAIRSAYASENLSEY